ncbi:MAG: nitrophenyl compound nitroreductase subunit ArsF family protein [Candidatus Heimdallarchaeota archaeon]
MKKIILLSVFVILAVAVSIYAFSGNANSQKTEVDSVVKTVSSVSDSKVVAYYFYTTARCVSCHKIEQYTKESLEKYFFDEIASGKIDFQMINIDEPQNKHFIQDYQLYTKSVVLSKVSDGKEVKFKNLDKVWNLLGSKDKFYEYIKDETNNFIN